MSQVCSTIVLYTSEESDTPSPSFRLPLPVSQARYYRPSQSFAMQSFVALEMDEIEFKKPGMSTSNFVLDTVVELPLPLSTRSSQVYPNRSRVQTPASFSGVDDYPDGGLAAWAVLFGVRPLMSFVLQHLPMTSTHVGYMCNLRDVRCNP